MYQALKIKNLVLGEGRPKICVPLTGVTEEKLLAEAKAAREENAELVEWRGDRCQEIHNTGRMEEIAVMLRRELPDCPILFTCRTEDGQFSIDENAYMEINRCMIDTGSIDLIDIELFMGEHVCTRLAEYAHERGVYVIISNHDFQKTPDVDVIVQRILNMRYLGADIPKIAVMPKQPRDVLKLLQATDTYNQWYGDCPIITMSMGKKGAVSRLCGETFGSAVTFATVGEASAPGQMTVATVRGILEVLRE